MEKVIAISGVVERAADWVEDDIDPAVVSVRGNTAISRGW